VAEEVEGRSFFRTEIRDGQVTFILDPTHEFYRRFFGPFENAACTSTGSAKQQLELILYALGHTELLDWSPQERETLRRFFTEWSRALSVFLGDRDV
jgi:hypothetical protein